MAFLLKKKCNVKPTDKQYTQGKKNVFFIKIKTKIKK